MSSNRSSVSPFKSDLRILSPSMFLISSFHYRFFTIIVFIFDLTFHMCWWNECIANEKLTSQKWRLLLRNKSARPRANRVALLVPGLLPRPFTSVALRLPGVRDKLFCSHILFTMNFFFTNYYLHWRTLRQHKLIYRNLEARVQSFSISKKSLSVPLFSLAFCYWL